MIQPLIDNSTTFVPGDYVLVLPVNLLGTVKKIRFDNSNKAIYTIFTDDEKATPDGVYYARVFELKRVPKEEAKR